MAPSSPLAALLCLAAVALPAALALPATPLIAHAGGAIQGVRLRSAGLSGPSRDYAAFWGVPYAQPPVGSLRFKPPQPKDLPAESIFMANNADAPICAQQRRHPVEVLGQEDCLTLQIYTPNFDEPDLPVIVFIHGGGFMYGKGPREGVQFVLDHDVVLVNVDYRLGVLGYLSFEDAELPGNMGMLDQVEALRWVQRNIHHFGGDNKTVTLVGHSAGSASALMHTMSPLSKGLFHRVIGMSGAPLNPWTRQYSARENADKVANLTGCDAPTTALKVACLQNKTATELVTLQNRAFQDNRFDAPFSPFAPVVDGVFLPDEPAKLLGKSNAVADVPLLLSFTPEEGLYTAGEFIDNAALMEELDSHWEQLAPRLLHFHDKRIPEQDKPAVARKIREKYLPNNETLMQNKTQLIGIMSDGNFMSGLEDYIVRRAKAQAQPVYALEFAYNGQFSLYPGGHGTSHADDIQYPFEFLWWSGVFTRPDDLAVRKDMVDAWVTFAKTSVPKVRSVDWRPVDRRGAEQGLISYFKLDGAEANMTLSRKDVGRAYFWRDLNINPNHSARAQASLLLCLAAVAALLLR